MMIKRVNKKGQALGGFSMGIILALVGVFLTILVVTIFLPLIDTKVTTYYNTNKTGTGQSLLYAFLPIFDILIAIAPLGVLGYLSYVAFKGQ